MEKSMTATEIKLKNEVERIGYIVDMSAQFGKYVVDLYIAEIHVAVEYDGPSHTFKKRDKARDAYLMENFFLPTQRINEKDYRQHLVHHKLTTFFELWSISAEERKKKHEDRLFEKLKEA